MATNSRLFFKIMNSKPSTKGFDVDDKGNQVFNFLVLDARKSIPFELQTCGIPGCGARFRIVDYNDHQRICPKRKEWQAHLQLISSRPMW